MERERWEKEMRERAMGERDERESPPRASLKGAGLNRTQPATGTVLLSGRLFVSPSLPVVFLVSCGSRQQQLALKRALAFTL